MDKSDFLKQIYQGSGFGQHDLTRIINHHQTLTFKLNEYLIKKGSATRGYYILKSGVALSYSFTTKNDQITTDFFIPGEVVIDVGSLFQGREIQQDYQAITEIDAFYISFEAFQMLFDDIPAFREWGRGWMAQTLVATQQKLTQLKVLEAIERYDLLLKTKPQVLQYASQKSIASYLGITPTSLSRVRREYAQDY